MKKTLIALGILTTLLIGAQTSFAACPCENPCPSCPVITPCCPAAPVVCPTNCETVYAKNNCGKCKCKWYKIFQNKCCCDKPTSCGCGATAKRCHWYKFWEDRCIVKNSVTCDCCDKCNSCDDNCCDKCNKCNDCCD